jgi:GAF domain-containing protein
MSAPTPSAAPHLRLLLDLLAEDAPAEALGAVSSQARAAGVPAGELVEVEAATATALRIRGALRQHRRRELQLTALFDTAGDLAASRDLDDVLKAIVRRARMLLGTDTAYLTLPDEEAGDTYMRVTDGSVSLLFQRLRLELGEGLGGLVAQTASPYATPDYRTDDRFRHTRNINAGVLDEGLVAILGVPLLLGSSRGGTGKVIGVLFAADRAPRVFSPDEVALLCSLAAHAAIAIDTARALADTRSALAELAEANAELAEANAAVREHSAAMQRAEEAHDRLTDLVLRGGDVKDVAAAVAGLLDSPLTIMTRAGARWRPSGPTVRLSQPTPWTPDGWSRPPRSPAPERAPCTATAGGSAPCSPGRNSWPVWSCTSAAGSTTRTGGSSNVPPWSPASSCCCGARSPRPRTGSAAS